jgi:hypothetical protein
MCFYTFPPRAPLLALLHPVPTRLRLFNIESTEKDTAALAELSQHPDLAGRVEGESLRRLRRPRLHRRRHGSALLTSLCTSLIVPCMILGQAFYLVIQRLLY